MQTTGESRFHVTENASYQWVRPTLSIWPGKFVAKISWMRTDVRIHLIFALLFFNRGQVYLEIIHFDFELFEPGTDALELILHVVQFGLLGPDKAGVGRDRFVDVL